MSVSKMEVACVVLAAIIAVPAYATVLFEENFDGTAGQSVATIGWTQTTGSLNIDSTVIDSGNSAGKTADGSSNDIYEKALPGGAYTLGAGEYFRYSFVLKNVAGAQNNSIWVILGQDGGSDYQGTHIDLYPTTLDLGSTAITGGTVTYTKP